MDAHEHHRHGHGNGHDHHGHHHHAPARMDRAFAIGAAVNLAFVIGEFGFGVAANSIALIADAAHNLGDVLGLLLAWAAAVLGRRPPTSRRTYGWGRGTILAALANAAVLLIGVGAIGIEALHRLMAPEPVQTGLVMAVAAIGILVNGGSALLFLRERAHDLNVRAQFVHLAGDAAISAGVVLAALAIRLTGYWWLDPLASLIVAGLIAAGTWGILRESLGLALDAVPEKVRQQDVAAFLASVPGVIEVHDLHIWGLSTTETALTAHLVFAGEAEDRRPHELSAELKRRFGIGHATVQIESDADAALCRLRPNDVV
jgi:cobalt-zinc-cadmium efflux system protein